MENAQHYYSSHKGKSKPQLFAITYQLEINQTVLYYYDNHFAMQDAEETE